MKKIIALLLCVVFVLSVVPYNAIAAENAQSVSDSVVYLNGTDGSDSNSGKTAAKAVATLARAIEVANTYADAKKVYVVVTGDTAIPEAQHVLPANNKPIVVTSVYGGNDYKAKGAEFITYNANCAAIHFNGTFTFEKITIKTTNANSIFALQYNSFTAGEGIDFVTVKDAAKASSYPIILVGCNTNSGTPYDKAITPTTFTNDVNIEVNSGTWAYIRGGDRDSKSTYDGNMTININGGKFLCSVTSPTGHYTGGNINGPTGKSSYGPNAKIVMNLKGGEMNSLIGCAYVGEDSGHTNAADITINIFDGFKLTNKFVAVQSNYAVFNGKLTVNLYGGDLTGLVEAKLLNASVANGGNGTVTVNYDINDAHSAAAFKALIDVCLDDTNVKYGKLEIMPCTVVYVKDGGTGNGSTPATALGSLAAAYDRLELSMDCTIVICGTYTQTGEFKCPIEYDGKLTITSVYGGVDYRDTADAEYVVKSGYRFFLYGDTAFDDIDVRLKGNYWLFIAQCNDAYFGEGFETAFEGNSDGLNFASAIGVLGGFQGSAGLADDNLNCNDSTNITILSGSNWVVSTYNRQLEGGNHSGKATVVIGGDAEVGTLYYTSVNKPGVLCGNVEITVKDNASVGSVLASPNNGAAITTKSLTVNWRGGNIATVSLAGAATNAAVITNGATLNYDIAGSANESFATVSALFDEVNVTVKGGVTSIGKDTLTNWGCVSEITIPESVTAIEAGVFGECADLEKITVFSAVAELEGSGISEGAVIVASIGTPAHQYAIENGNKFIPIDLKISSASLSLYNNLTVNFNVKKEAFDALGYTDPCVKVTMNGATTVISKYSVSGGSYVFSFRNLAPYLVNEEMVITIYAKRNGTEYEGETRTYSIAQYCYNQLGKTEDSKFRTLLVDLLNYGAEAQKYKGYKTDDLANSALTPKQAAYGTATDPELKDMLSFIGEATEVAVWKSASLYLNDKITVRFKFQAADATGMYVKAEIGGVEYKINNVSGDANGIYVARVESFNAAQLREEIKATVCDASGNAVSNTVVYSVESYVARNIDDESLVGLMKAMMKYGDAAQAFIKPDEEPSEPAEPVIPKSNVKQFDAAKLGNFYNYCPTVITEPDGTRYIYYCTNKNSNNVTDYIGCRKGTPNADGSYSWSAETLVLSPGSNGAWDARHACDPSVIKGVFNYNGTEYSYLMAYLGCTSNDSQENKIGLAVANDPMGPFVKVGTEPLVDFEIDPSSDVFQWGVGQASLVSMDKAGKVWLFYTRGDKNGTRTVVRECDFSNLNAPVMSDEVKVSTSGLTNLNGKSDFMNNADFVYDPDTYRFYSASDCHPNPSDEPSYISSTFRVNYFNGTKLNVGIWQTLEQVGPDETGWARNHNVCLARDEYGHLYNKDYITVYYTVGKTATGWSKSEWSYRIYEYNIELN